MKKVFAMVMTMVMLLSICAFSCAEESDLKYVQDKGVMIIGITDFEPMDYMVDGDWTGFDAELARLVCEKLGVKAQFQEISWAMKETELAGRSIDCIWNGLTWSEERAENMGMSDPYMLNRQVIVVGAGNAERFTEVASFKGASVAAESGSAGEELIQNVLGDAVYIEKEGQIDALTELLFGTVDAVVIDYTMAYYLINKEGSDFASLVILDNFVEAEEEYYAIACRKGSDMTDAVNAALKELKDDGTVDALADQYGLKDAVVK